MNREKDYRFPTKVDVGLVIASSALLFLGVSGPPKYHPEATPTPTATPIPRSTATPFPLTEVQVALRVPEKDKKRYGN